MSFSTWLDCIKLKPKKITPSYKFDPFTQIQDFDELFSYIKGKKIRNKLWCKSDYIIPQSIRNECSHQLLSKIIVGLDQDGEVVDHWHLMNPQNWEMF